ncbi:RDD family protein [Mariniblastus fucicola]|uniref:RDD family protein n=1 Tax=Mariniblastus fucicola TaxID=980251 RepID=A0A5B9PH46_9BACT|nr:RDD family protein [Mariniblastus fucicola]QEG22023.1 RDD family protein [Mariniblastus fucicola]
MSDNPFQSPEHAMPVHTATSMSPELADRSSRFVGALIDSILMIVILMPVSFLIIIPIFAGSLQEAGSLTFNIGYILSGFVVSQLVFLALQGYLLANKGQTIGKLVVKTQILDEQGRIPDFWPMYLKRYLAMAFIYSIPYIGGVISIVNALLIFRESRKCLHDDIAGTKVVKFFGQ